MGVGLAEIYERLYNLPNLERSFRAEVTYWMRQYEEAKGELEKLSKEYSEAKHL